MSESQTGPVRAASVEELHERALACFSTNRLPEAESLCRQALVVASRNAGVLNLLGQVLLKLRRPEEATTLFSQAIELEPDLANLHFNLALAYQGSGKTAEAIQSVQQAISLDPKVPVLHAKLGQLLCTIGANAEAIKVLRNALELDPKSVPVRINLAQALTDFGDVAEAEKTVRAAIFLEPRDATAHRLLGRIHQLNGRLEEAGESFRTAIRLQPGQAAPYYALAYSKRVDEKERPLLRSMEHLLSRPDLPQADRGLLHYALGKSLDDLKEYDAAMGHFDEANAIALTALHSTGRTFDAAQETAEVDSRIQAFTSEALNLAARTGNPSDRPIFIVGMIRSGTTLVEQILSSHPDVAAAGELSYWLAQDRNWLETGAHPEDTSAKIDEYLGILNGVSSTSARVTDKMPLNYLAMGLIHMAFPKAKFVHCRRNPIDTCLSVYVTPYRGSPLFGHNRENIAAAYREYLRLMQHWRTVIPSSQLIELNYEELVADREAKARELIDFCGLPWNEALLDPEANRRFVNTPSLWQVRQPIYRSSVDRWKNYERHLGVLRELLP
jgi:tetratricopeptide (TPR) repeat protein